MNPMNISPKRCFAAALLAAVMASPTMAQVPADLVEGNRAIGKKNDVVASAELYGPLAQRPPYTDVKVTRDVSYGPDQRNVVDVFAPEAGGRNLPVVIFISGGGGNRILPDQGAEPFFDNIMLWAAKHDMVGVNLGRRNGRDLAWDAGVQDVAAVVKWARSSIGSYGGDPSRIFFLGHGAGASLLTVYLADPQYWGADSPGLKGVMILSTPLNIAPLVSSGRVTNPLFDPSHSVLEGLRKSKVPLYIGLPEYAADETAAQGQALRQDLCSRGTCPGFAVFKDHQHHSLSFAFNTSDESVSGALLEWMRSIR